jgi:hypothetical protein
MTIQLSYPPSFPSLPSRTLPPSLQISLANSCSIIELSITIIISCAPFAIGFWRRIYQNSALFSSIRSRNNLRKSNDRPPTTPPLSTIRTSRIGSAGSDFNLEGLYQYLSGGADKHDYTRCITGSSSLPCDMKLRINQQYASFS